MIVVDFTGYGMTFSTKMGLIYRYFRKWGRPPRRSQSGLSPEDLVRMVEDSGFTVEGVELLESEANAIYLRGRKR